jgi:hypothetical protein
VWDVDVSQGGKVCVAKGGKLALWRPDSEAEATVNIRAEDGSSQALSWAAGKALADWPAALPITNSTYQVEWADTGEKSSLDIVTIPQPPPTDVVGAAQVLIENGCQRQLDLLVESASKAK